MKIKLYHYIFFSALLLFLVPVSALRAQQLSLEECRALALMQNKKIKAADYNISAAVAALESANKNSLPAIDGSVMGLHFGKPLDAILPPVIGAASVTASQPVYVGGKIRLGKQAATKAIELYRDQKTLTETEVLLNVEKAYWQVVQVSEKIILSEKYIAMLQRLQTDLKNSYDAGLIYKNDLLKVDVSVNEARLNLQKANDGRRISMLYLAQLIGKGDSTNFAVKDSVSGAFNPITTNPGFSIGQRPELKVLESVIEIEQLQTQILKADRKPAVAIGAGALTNAGRQINFKDGSNSFVSYFGMLNISIPILDWGKTAKKVKEQELKILAKKEELSEAKELINLEVLQAGITVNQAVTRIELSKLSLVQAEENVKLANDRYEAGTIVGKDVLEAQALWQLAYSNLIDAKIEYKVAVAAYKKAISENK